MEYYRIYVGVSYRRQPRLNSRFYKGDSEMFKSMEQAEKWLVKKLQSQLNCVYFFRSFTYAIYDREGNYVTGRLHTKRM